VLFITPALYSRAVQEVKQADQIARAIFAS
jgi:hypothetical protein